MQAQNKSTIDMQSAKFVSDKQGLKYKEVVVKSKFTGEFFLTL
jgi:hypothetical protein